MRTLKIVCLLLLGGSAFAESRQFMCLAATADGPRGNNVTVVTKTADILGTPHQVGTAEIGRWGGSAFWISWDATASTVSIGRKDTDGFEMSASADGGTVIVLIAKRPNEPEIRLFCGAK